MTLEAINNIFDPRKLDLSVIEGLALTIARAAYLFGTFKNWLRNTSRAAARPV